MPALLLLVHAAAAIRAPFRSRAACPAIHRAGPIVLADADAERRERLRQLFGEAAANKLAKPAKPDEPDIAMLVEGMQRLDWGATRLVDVDMAPGPLELSLSPLLPRGSSQLLCVRLDMPLGLLLEEDDADASTDAARKAADDAPPRPRLLSVAEVFDEGSAGAGGVRVGDLLRATTIVTMGMSYPTWQLMMGGVGKPALQKVLMPTSGQPFEKVIDGGHRLQLGGRRQLGQRASRAAARAQEVTTLRSWGHGSTWSSFVVSSPQMANGRFMDWTGGQVRGRSVKPSVGESLLSRNVSPVLPRPWRSRHRRWERRHSSHRWWGQAASPSRARQCSSWALPQKLVRKRAAFFPGST